MPDGASMALTRLKKLPVLQRNTSPHWGSHSMQFRTEKRSDLSLLRYLWRSRLFAIQLALIVLGTLSAHQSSSAHDLPVELLASAESKAESQQLQREFEGEYVVGKTKCVVTPRKMSFEVRWAHDKRKTNFFFESTDAEGRFTFVSDDKPDGRDRFVFDSPRLNTGVFLQSDGAKFFVKRASN